jgi:hypothetical protein
VARREDAGDAAETALVKEVRMTTVLLYLLAWLMGAGLAHAIAMVLDDRLDDGPPPAVKLLLVVLWPLFFALLGVAAVQDRVEDAVGG